MRFRAFAERVGPRILSLESVDYFGTSEHFSGRKKKPRRMLISKTSIDGEANWSFIVCKLVFSATIEMMRDAPRSSRIFIYYIHTEKYSPKSCVVNFDSQMSSSQSDEWNMVFTREKNDTSNQNRERCFFTCEKNDTSNQKPQRCGWVSRQNSRLFLQLAERRFAHIREEKFFSKSFFSLKKWKTFHKWSEIVSFVSLSIKKTVESRRNNSGRVKTEQDVSLCCAFCRSYYVFHL